MEQHVREAQGPVGKPEDGREGSDHCGWLLSKTKQKKPHSTKKKKKSKRQLRKEGKGKNRAGTCQARDYGSYRSICPHVERMPSARWTLWGDKKVG